MSALNISSVQLMTNNPAKILALVDLGINVVNRIPLHIDPSNENKAYIATKEKKMGHWPSNP